MLCFFDYSLLTWVPKKRWCGFDWRRWGRDTDQLRTVAPLAVDEEPQTKCESLDLEVEVGPGSSGSGVWLGLGTREEIWLS